MTDQMNFAYNTDTGEADASSINPWTNGETGNQTTLQRAAEHLRNRTDQLRAEVHLRGLAQDMDRAMLLDVDSGTVTWAGTTAGGGTGKLVLSGGASLIMIPFMTPGSSRGTSPEATGTRAPSRLPYKVLEKPASAGTHDIQIVSDKLVHAGGNEITIEIVDDPGSGAVAVTVGGDGTVSDPFALPGKDNIVVTYDSSLAHSVANIVSALNTDPVSNALITATFVGSGASSDVAYEIAKTGLTGGLDGVFHEITDTVLDAFFTAHADNLLKEGDTLAIWFSSMATRKDNTEVGGAHLVVAGSLVNLSREPEKARNCIPLGKVIDDTFVAYGGALLAKGVASSSLPGDGQLRADIARPLATPSPGSASYGSDIIGVDTSTLTYINPADAALQTTLERINFLLDGLDTAVSDNLNDIQDLELEAAKTDAEQYLHKIAPSNGYGGRVTPDLDLKLLAVQKSNVADLYAGAISALPSSGATHLVYDGATLYRLDADYHTTAAAGDNGPSGPYVMDTDALAGLDSIDCDGTAAVAVDNAVNTIRTWTNIYDGSGLSSRVNTSYSNYGFGTVILESVYARGEYFWMIVREERGSNDWRSLAVAFGSYAAPAALLTLDLFSTDLSNAQTDVTFLAADFDRHSGVVAYSQNVAGTPANNGDILVKKITGSSTDPVGWLGSAAVVVADSTGSLQFVHLLDRYVILVGENLGGTPGTNDIMVITRESFDRRSGLGGTVAGDWTTIGTVASGGLVLGYGRVDTCVLGDILYILAVPGTTPPTSPAHNARIEAYRIPDMTWLGSRYLDVGAATPTTLSTNGQYLYVGCNDGSLRALNALRRGGAVGYNTKGAAPNWTRQYLLDGYV